MWSLGICILEMAEFNPPFFDYEITQISQALINSPPPTFKTPSMWSLNLIEFVSSILLKDSVVRKSARQLLDV